MIQEFTIKNIATYNESGVKFTNLRKINFIYGSNGSGKTTVSKFLAFPQNEDYTDSELIWENNMPLNTLVYNRQFKEENFGKGTINGVFTLGHATKDELEIIESKKKGLSTLTEEGKKQKGSLEKLKSDLKICQENFRDKTWQKVYKKYENNFKEAFRGYLYKQTFMDKLLEEYGNNSSEIIEFEQLLEKSKIVFKKNVQSLSLLPLVNGNELDVIEQNEIWDKKIIGHADVNIGNLIQRLNINDWVNEGRKYIQKDNHTCPFCQKETVTEEFRKQLELYFNETFTANIQTVQSLGENYVAVSTELISLLESISERERQNPESKLNKDLYDATLKTLNGTVAGNKEYIHNKQKEPSRSINLVSTMELQEKLKCLITAANQEISKHNRLVENLHHERQKLIMQVWKFVTVEYQDEIKSYLEEEKKLMAGVNGLEKKVARLREDYAALNGEISRLTQNVTSVQPSIDEINRILRLYGFTNFQIVPASGYENQYQIQRENGTLAETTLSEGEITFITFLYFMQLAKGSIDKERIMEDRVVVIDDPVGSLDGNVLFIVSSLIKEMIKQIKNNAGNIKQLIVLTHNIYFHKEVSFVDGRTSKNKSTYYWILRKTDNVTSVKGYEMENPIVSSYELLWKELQERDNNSGLTIQNTMRRIIENYFKILGKFGDDELIHTFTNPQEQEICRSLICRVNDGSHCLPDDLYVEAPCDTIAKYFEVFRKIFEKTGHIAHYNMMMEVK